MLVGGKPTAGGRLRRSEATGCERRRPKGGGSPEASPDGLGRGGQNSKTWIVFEFEEEKQKNGYFFGSTEGGDGRRGETA